MDIKEIIKKMSLEEKASLLSGLDFWKTTALPQYDIKSMFLSDGPSGVRKQAEASDHLGLNQSLHATCFPSSGTISNSWNPEIAKEVGHYLGAEALSQNVNILLAPGMNIKRNPRCGRNFEYYSEDPYLAGKMASGFINGVQENGISACVKHFACNNQESQRLVMDTIVDERTLREIYLTGFEIVVKEAKPLTLMTSYNLINGTYANENYHLLRDILRNDWGYKGMIVTDWGGNNDRVEALKCGSDLEMPSTNGETNRDIVKAVREGKIDESLLDESVERILNNHELTKKAFNKQLPFEPEESLKVARKAAEESIVLLKNDNVLPLDKTKKICVIGDFADKPRYQGAGSSQVNAHHVVSLLDAIKEDKDFNLIGYESGYKRFGKKSKSLVKKALKLASKSEIIILALGLDECAECEGIDRKHIKIRQNQIDLINALSTLNKPIIGVMYAGAAVELGFDDKLNALLQCSLLGEQGGYATVDILTGKVNPSGKLAETYPVEYEDVSTADNFPGLNRRVIYKEGPYIGYRYFDKQKTKPKYCFGFGLSYTSFEYSDLEVNDDGVKFKIKNIGTVDGKETAMMFVSINESKTYRVSKELKGFKKVFIKAGETKEVEIKFDEFTFRVFDMKKNRFIIETGDYNISIAANANDIKLVGKIHKDGEELETLVNENDIPHLYSGNVKEITPEEKEKIFLGTEIHELPTRTGKLVVDYNTTVLELKHAKGWFGRAFAGGLVFAYKLLNFFGQRMTANTLEMGMFHSPMRNIARMSGGMISMGQLDGMIMMFNGHFHKGLGKFFKAGKEAKKLAKENKKQASK